MTTDRHQRQVEIFHKARDAEPDRRAAILDEACGDDLELRREVEALLAEARDESTFLEKPALGKDFQIDDPLKNDAEKTIQSVATAKAAFPKQIGGYSIKRIIASGGMGTVYLSPSRSSHGGL